MVTSTDSSVSYTFNFLWVNLNPQDRIRDAAQHIFGDGLDPSEQAECIQDSCVLRRWEEREVSLLTKQERALLTKEEQEELENWQKVKRTCSYRISKWADGLPGAQINLWYDSALVTTKARENTLAIMDGIARSRGVDLRLRDVRILSNIKGELRKALHPGVPVYYRVDLLKACIADYLISARQESAQYCVISDFDVTPQSQQELFDPNTLQTLSERGYVFHETAEWVENSFFIFSRNKKEIQMTHRRMILEAIAERISELREYSINSPFSYTYILDAQAVYRLYHPFLVELGERELLKKETQGRKIMQCPQSQFNFGGSFSEAAHQAESWRFIGKDDVPYTKKGRNYPDLSEKQIDFLIGWKEESLSDLEGVSDEVLRRNEAHEQKLFAMIDL